MRFAVLRFQVQLALHSAGRRGRNPVGFLFAQVTSWRAHVSTARHLREALRP